MNEMEIKTLVRKMDSKDTAVIEAAWLELKPLGAKVVRFFVEEYTHTKRMEGRRAMVFHSIKFARVSNDAFQLGLLAITDKASIVRYRGCGLLAYSLRHEALPHLEKLLTHQDRKTVEDAQAAIDAIKNQNHHLFIDRQHTGRVFWQLEQEGQE